MTAGQGSLSVAVLAPAGRDGAVAERILSEANLQAAVCGSLPELLKRLHQEGAGAAIVADEALLRADLQGLVDWISAQPPWGDFPFVVLTRQSSIGDRNAAEQRLMERLGNVTFLERPFHPTTLVSLVRSALRGRRRQYEARDRLVAVHEGQQSLELALAAGQLGAWELSLKDGELTASAHCKANFGRGASDRFTYDELAAAIHPEDRARQKAAVDKAIENRDGFAVVYRAIWPDGSMHWIEVTGRARTDEQGVIAALVGVSANISERVHAEHERERLLAELSTERAVLERRVLERTAELMQANGALKAEMEAKTLAELQLRQAQKIETMGQLVGGVAHDFNNLLMVVMANLDLLRRRLAADPPNLRLAEGAKRGAERGAELTKRLLAFARRQDLQPESVQLGDLLAGMLQLVERSIGPFIELKLERPPELPPVRVDPNQLEMALLNLTVNARDAMPTGGHLWISMLPVPAEPGNPMGLAPGPYVRILVRDTGHGMDAATLGKSIEPFFSTKGVGKGTGLGLSMVHGMARQSGGAFVMRSEPGRGTEAELWLPVSMLPVAPRHLAGTSRAAAGDGHILVVDDDELVAAGTTAMLEDLGYSVTQMHSGREALEAIDKGLKPSLMVTDHAMPGMTGAELARKVKAQDPALPILIVTGYADLLRDETFEVPKLTKPYSQEQLSAEVGRLLATAKG